MTGNNINNTNFGQPTLLQVEGFARNFNKRFPVGTEVLWWKTKAKAVRAKITSPARAIMLSDYNIICGVDGQANVSIDAVEALS